MMNVFDDIGLTLQHEASIAEFERKRGIVLLRQEPIRMFPE